MDAFVRRLVQRLLDPSRPLSRNRHFHTLATPEGQRAVRLARRLRALERDLVACVEAGQSPVVLREGDGRGSFCVTVRLEALGASHRATLSAAEYELLCQLPRAAQVLGEPAQRPSSAPTPK